MQARLKLDSTMRGELKLQGFSETDISMLEDLINHAATEAFATIERIAEAAPRSGLRVSVLYNALQALGAAAPVVLEAAKRNPRVRTIDL